jgi:cysteine protease ATG4
MTDLIPIKMKNEMSFIFMKIKQIVTDFIIEPSNAIYEYFFGELVLNDIDTDHKIFVCYRYGFPQVQGYTNDCGWGCTIRSFQMLIANTFQKLNISIPYENLLMEDSTMFSLHKILESGLKYNMEAGKWISPSIVARSVRDISFANNEDLLIIVASSFYYEEDCQEHMDTYPKLLLVPSMYGIYNIDLYYVPKLIEFFKDPNSMGAVGGKGHSSYYFTQMNMKTGKLKYLDPHELKKYDDIQFIYNSNRKELELSLTDISPTLTLAYLVKDEEEEELFYKKYSILIP